MTQPTDPLPAPPATEARDRHVARIARGGAAGLAGAGASAVLTLAFTVLVTRTLSTSEAGVFFAVTSAFLIAYATASVGVPSGVVYFIARFRATGQAQLLRPTTRHAVAVVGAAATCLAVVGLVLAPQIAGLLGGSGADGTTLVRVLCVALVAAVLNDVAVGLTRGYDTMRPFVLVERLARPMAQLVLGLLVVVGGAASATSLGLAWSAPFVVTCAVLLAWARRLRQRAERAGGVDEAAPASADVAGFWRFTAPRSLASISQMVLQRADIVLLGVLAGPAPAAVYTAATRFLVFGQLGAGAISTTMQPRLAALLATGDLDSARAIYRVGTVWLVLLAWPAYLLAAVFAPELLLLFGEDYREGTSVVVVLSLTMLVATGCGAVDVVLTMAGRSTWTMANALAAVALNLVLNVVLIPRMGVLGAAIAWAAAILLRNLLPLAQLALHLRLHPFGRTTAAAAVLALLCAGAVPLGARVASGGSVAATAAAATLGLVAYVLVVLRHRSTFDLHQFRIPRRRRA